MPLSYWFILICFGCILCRILLLMTVMPKKSKWSSNFLIINVYSVLVSCVLLAGVLGVVHALALPRNEAINLQQLYFCLTAAVVSAGLTKLMRIGKKIEQYEAEKKTVQS